MNKNIVAFYNNFDLKIKFFHKNRLIIQIFIYKCKCARKKSSRLEKILTLFLVEKTPYGRFWIGKSDPSGTGTNVETMVVLKKTLFKLLAQELTTLMLSEKQVRTNTTLNKATNLSTCITASSKETKMFRCGSLVLLVFF